MLRGLGSLFDMPFKRPRSEFYSAPLHEGIIESGNIGPLPSKELPIQQNRLPGLNAPQMPRPSFMNSIINSPITRGIAGAANGMMRPTNLQQLGQSQQEARRPQNRLRGLGMSIRRS
jgi:hypothetical protein